VIARMWEGRINLGQLDEFCSWIRDEALPQFKSADGFVGGELYRADEPARAVVITRWSDADALAAGSAWFDLGAERFCGHEPSAWQFTPVDLS
jgi:heme-degrading monooxygenase HmoA